MATVVFEIGGKRVEPTAVQNPLERSVYESIRNNLHSRFGSLRCPRHHGEPVITVSGPSIDKVGFEVTGCCQELLDLVQKRAES